MFQGGDWDSKSWWFGSIPKLSADALDSMAEKGAVTSLRVSRTLVRFQPNAHLTVVLKVV